MRRTRMAVLAATFTLLGALVAGPAGATDAPGARAEDGPRHLAEDVAAPYRPIAGAPTYHYRELADGSQQTTVQYGRLRAATADPVPFNYTISMSASLRGRDMTSTTGWFCNWYTSTGSGIPDSSGIDYVRVRLRETVSGGSDPILSDWYDFANDQSQHVHCWSGISSSKIYHFDYALYTGAIGYQVEGQGTVTG